MAPTIDTQQYRNLDCARTGVLVLVDVQPLRDVRLLPEMYSRPRTRSRTIAPPSTDTAESVQA